MSEHDAPEPTGEEGGQTWLPPVVARPKPPAPELAPSAGPPSEQSGEAGEPRPAEPGVPAGGEPGEPHPVEPDRAPSGEPSWPLLIMLGSFAVLLVAVAFWWSSRSSLLEVALPTVGPTAPPATAAPSGASPTGASSTVADAGFAFLATAADGTPYRWDPCAPVRYVVNTDNAPAGALTDVQEAVRRVALATGMSFEYGGTTSETVAQRRSTGYVVAGSDGSTWAPVLIAWASSAELQSLGYDPAATGAGGPFPSEADVGQTTGRYVSGLIVLNAGTSPPPANGFATPTSWGVVLMHELGHLLGLAHVDDPDQIMDTGLSQPRTVTDWGPGDRQGLALVGRQAGCLPAATPTA